MTKNVLDYLESSANRCPDKIAIIEEDSSVTYSEFVDICKRIGSYLASSVKSSTPVGVYMEKGIDALCAFFGTVYAGGFYSLLSTELPDARLQQIQSVLQTKVIITTSDLFKKASEIFNDVDIYIIDELKQADVNQEILNTIRSKSIDTNPLYLNFTSGSTGVPKGILVAHRSVIDFIDCFTDLFSVNEEDIIANQAPFDFDVSVKDIYSAIKVAATLVIVPRKLFSAPVSLIDYLDKNKVTTMIWAVSALCLITTFHGLDYKTPKSIKKILFSGEVMPYKHLCEWQKHLPDAMFVNLYGPTEITCNCAYHILEKGRDYSAGIPIGIPFPNEDIILLDKNNNAINTPDNIGMIVVRGTALALGYYRLSEKNAECFIQNPLNDAYPETVYLTGDLGMYSESGELLFCGRADNQVKYMGHRIELEEVERAMAAIDGVERCFCIFDQKKERLKGFYTGSIEKNELHTVLKNTMPIFMVPGFIRKLDEIPLTKNGKIDRKKITEEKLL